MKNEDERFCMSGKICCNSSQNAPNVIQLLYVKSHDIDTLAANKINKFKKMELSSEKIFNCKSANDPNNRAFSPDVTAAMLVYQNKETAAMLVFQTNP